MAIETDIDFVSADTELSCQKLDAVLPLTLNDYERFEILQQSLNVFCKELFGTIWIVVPDAQFSEISQRVRQEKFCVISESTLIPELNFFSVKGWYLQQLIKLAIANHIKTNFYLTLDADVICAKPVQFSDLVKEGRAVYYAIDSDQYENKLWYEWSRNALKLKPRSQHNCYNVTPAVLSRDVVLQLQQYLRQLSNAELTSGLKFSSSKRRNLILLLSWLSCRVLPRKSALREQLLDYKTYLIRNIPWTEYALYYSFCEMKELLDQYHVRIPNCIYSGKESVWHEDQYTKWQPESWFEGERNFFFCVFQSNTQIPAEIIWQKIEKFLC
ncbi:DUF6492 family protein [Leptolyngbya sp. FACHB-711]|uniref:DUF6492 family protein n=1 Tax=Leptolyngbya sp. FACHB-711 TaxID=2692813 RepID=UPI0016822E60|nr:DUF6492 family protein [Leptolyngbya sp. FACHB-711]MBD2028215.1 hypothetical protein [Leptolyngbya sp. FACHB-711]